jgi:hypothetical protein
MPVVFFFKLSQLVFKLVRILFIGFEFLYDTFVFD